MTTLGMDAAPMVRIPILKMVTPERDREMSRINAHQNFLRDFGREAVSDEEAYEHNRKLAEEIIAKCGNPPLEPIPRVVREYDENGCCKVTEAAT